MDLKPVIRVLFVAVVLTLSACQPSAQTASPEQASSLIDEQPDLSSAQSINLTELPSSQNMTQQNMVDVDVQTTNVANEIPSPDQASKPITEDVDKFAMSEQLEQMRQNLDDSFNKSTPPRKSFDDCIEKTSGNTFAIVDCIDIEFSYQDKLLNKKYKALMSSLSVEKKNSLRDEQRLWLKKTNEGCIYMADIDGQAGLINSKSCRLNRTINRLAEFERMFIE